MRLRSDIWVSAFLRRCDVAGAQAVLRRRGGAEAGAILIRVDRLDGRSTLLGPAPPSAAENDAEARRFSRMHAGETINSQVADDRLAREIGFDPDLWIIDVEDRAGRSFLMDEEIAEAT